MLIPKINLLLSNFQSCKHKTVKGAGGSGLSIWAQNNNKNGFFLDFGGLNFYGGLNPPTKFFAKSIFTSILKVSDKFLKNVGVIHKVRLLKRGRGCQNWTPADGGRRVEDKCGRPQNFKQLSNWREFIEKNVW